MTDRPSDDEPHAVPSGDEPHAVPCGDNDATDAPSVAARDELAGIVELFGALTRAELADALSELAFKRRADVDEAAVDDAIAAATAGYVIVPAPADAVHVVGGDDSDPSNHEPEADGLLAVGPAAFPTPPPNVEDLPHILDVPDRTVDRDRLAGATLDRLERDVSATVDDGNDARLEALLEVTYDIEAWAAVDATRIRDRVVRLLDE